jgi:hypothetical protein
LQWELCNSPGFKSLHPPTRRDLKGSRKGNTGMSIIRPKSAVKTEKKLIRKDAIVTCRVELGPDSFG